LISESLDGFSVAATLQYGGRSLFAVTAWAEVIVVSGNESDARLSHDAAYTGVKLSTVATNMDGVMATNWI
jgi:hypothetical protein